MLETGGTATVVVSSARMKVSYIAVNPDWFAEYIGTEMGNIYDCFISEVSINYIKINYLRCDLGDIRYISKTFKAF